MTHCPKCKGELVLVRVHASFKDKVYYYACTRCKFEMDGEECGQG